MANRSRAISQIANSKRLGVSFSVRLCNEMGIDWQQAMRQLAGSGIGRFRLMSYWDIHEKSSGKRNFELLDAQIDLAESLGCEITLCLGMRQPRWPETHIPDWAKALPKGARTSAYLGYQEEIITRYRKRKSIKSWQLENEFWNRGFGAGNSFDRRRLKAEFRQLRILDPARPIIMSLANTYGYPLRRPKPDLFGTTIYRRQYERDRYHDSPYPAAYFKLRRFLVRLLTGRDLIIHELQAEPWGPKSNTAMSDEEQFESMNAQRLEEILTYAKSTGIRYMDLWGGEWWCWRKLNRKDSSLLDAVAKFSETLYN